MKARVTAITVDLKNIPNLDMESDPEFESIKDSFEAFGGKNAGICYMADDYDKLENEEDTKSILRFIRTIKNTHHSISDHCNITVVFEEVPKFFAMVMNSFQVYATSEKSARYTVMKNLSEKEQRLYEKWIDKITKVLMEKYKGKGCRKACTGECKILYQCLFPSNNILLYDLIETVELHSSVDE